MPVEIIFKGKNHRIKAVVSSCFKHLLILGPDWPGFNKLVGQCVGVRSQHLGLCGMLVTLNVDTRSPRDAEEGEELTGPSQEALQFSCKTLMRISPLSSPGTLYYSHPSIK